MARLLAGIWVGWMLLAGRAGAQEDLQDSLSVDRAMSDSLRLDSLTVNTTILEWEELWAEWCATTHCVSSDTSLWNVSDTGTTRIGDNLDSATVATGLAAMNVLSELDLRWNPVAHRRIVTFGRQRTHHLGTMLGRSAMYFPLFEEVLSREGLPLELKYLSVVESGLNPEARSPVGARGLWQFMYYTAKAEGLRIDGYIDERKDPLLATEAACRHLKRLQGR